jgi:hypothetical protein
MKYFITFAFSFGILAFVQAETTVPPGEVYGTWAKSNSPYNITGTIYIPRDSTLIIEPGVKVEFQGNYEMKVMGRLLAEGTKTDTILFTVNDTAGYYVEDTTLGGWKGIRIYDIDESNDSTKLAYCRLEYGKAIGSDWNHSTGGALYVFQFDKVSVSHCLFMNNKACAYDDILSSGGAVYFEFSNISLTENTFIKNKAQRGGGVFFNASDPVFNNNLFLYNQSGWEGGGLSGGGESNPSFSGDVFRYNMSEEMGGGLMLYGPGNITLDQVSVLDNSANWAGGIGFVRCDVKIINSTISHNFATSTGGGIASDASTISVENSVFERDSSSNIAGGIHVWQGTLMLQNVSLTGNSALAGGGVNADWSQLVLEKSQFIANSAEGGGGLHLFNCHLRMDSCSMDGNTALKYAGAIDYVVDTLVFDSLFVYTLIDTQIINNHSGNVAGGLSIQQTRSDHPMLDLRIDNCLIANNSAHQVGGFRIFKCIKPLVISNSIIRGNIVEAWTGGGTISNQSRGHVYNCLFYDNHSATVDTNATSGGLGISTLDTKVDVNNCTFVGNSAGRGGGLQVYRGGNAIVSNSIFWENYPEQLALSSVLDSLPCKLTLNYNNIQYGLDSINITDTVSTLVLGEGNMDEDPLFVDTNQADFHLMDTSPAIGAARDSIEVEGVWYCSPPLDLDGNPRPNPTGSLPDLGVFENVKAWPVGIKEHQQDNSGGFEILTYPNPFRYRTTFEFSLPEQSHVTLEIFNLLGEHVYVIKYQHLEPGIHRVIWNPAQPENHVYFYRISMESVSNQVCIRTGQILRIK